LYSTLNLVADILFIYYLCNLYGVSTLRRSRIEAISLPVLVLEPSYLVVLFQLASTIVREGLRRVLNLFVVLTCLEIERQHSLTSQVCRFDTKNKINLYI